jgi:hypothetical protein
MNNIDTFQLGYDVSPMEIAFVAGKKNKDHFKTKQA